MMGRPAAFFDLDGTLLTVNSGRLWINNELRHGRLTLLQYLEATAYLVAYKLNRIDMETAIRRALLTIKGDYEHALRAKTRRWYFEEVAARAAPGGFSAIAEHRAMGHALILLTSSSAYESEAAIEHFGLDDFLCTRYEVRDGVFTGEPLSPLCFGEGKVYWAEKLAQEQDIDLSQSYFYSDSASDIPMLARVGHPRVIAPDMFLRREARRRAWPIVDWSKNGVAKGEKAA
jgi:HAD superfamily hydrolase (TIGR01490 family)